ncbi:MAG: hypothetical protein Q9190_005880 [Brigantiaea leucoxantha]
MVLLNASSFLILALSSSLVSATRFCQCENPSYDRIFPGINNVCDGMGEDWCSTNCNSVGYNCDYCQFKPAGYGSDADFAKLKAWCGQQEGYDSGKQISYKGTDVFCYSYKNRREKPWHQGGCTHENNGDWPLPPDKVRDAAVNFRYPFQGVYVKRVCDKMLRRDGPLLVEGYIKRNSDCTWLKNETTSHILECPYKEGRSNRNKLRQEFKDDCAYYGGRWYELDNGPAAIIQGAAELFVGGGIRGQRVLSRPRRKNLEHHSDIDVDELAGSEEAPDPPGDEPPPHGPGDIDKPDDPNKHHENDIIDEENRSDNDVREHRVVYEHDGMKITFVE